MGTLQELYSELIQVDASLIGDQFRPIFEKGLEISLIDYEEQIDNMEEELAQARREYFERKAQVYDDFTQAQFSNWAKYNKQLKADLEDMKVSIDKSLVPNEDDDIDCPSTGMAIYNFLEMYIDRMSLGTLAVIMDCLEQLHYKKEISWFYYIECGLAVSYRLTKAAPKGGWDEILYKLKAWKQANHTKTVSYEDKFYSSMSLDIEDAIDFMDKVRDLAKKNNVSETVMFYTLMEEHEAKAEGLPMEGYSQDLADENIEAMMMDFEANFNE